MLLALQLLVFSTSFIIAAPQRDCVYKNKTLVIALLALHHGENCDMVSQRGVQQMAALDWVREAAITDTSLPQIGKYKLYAFERVVLELE